MMAIVVIRAIVVITIIAATVGGFPLSTGTATAGWKRRMIVIVLIEMSNSSFVFESPLS